MYIWLVFIENKRHSLHGKLYYCSFRKSYLIEVKVDIDKAQTKKVSCRLAILKYIFFPFGFFVNLRCVVWSRFCYATHTSTPTFKTCFIWLNSCSDLFIPNKTNVVGRLRPPDFTPLFWLWGIRKPSPPVYTEQNECGRKTPTTRLYTLVMISKTRLRGIRSPSRLVYNR